MMQKNIKTIAQNSFLIAWSLLCIILFMVFPGRQNYLQWIALESPIQLFESFIKISLPHYFFEFIFALGGVAAYSICCGFLGLFIGSLIKIDQTNLEEPHSKAAIIVTQFLVGQSVFSLILLVYASIYKLTPFLTGITFLLGFLLGAFKIKNVFSYTGKHINFNGASKLILALATTILIITALQSSSRISYDSTAIYFSDAKLTAINQHTSYFADDTFVISVLQSTMQFSALIQLFGDQSARMVSWFCGLVICVLSLALGRKMGLSKNASVLLLTLLATSTAFTDLLGDGKVDLISGAYAITAVYWASSGIINKAPNKTALLLSGYLAGFACVTRPFNAFLITLLIIFYYLQIVFLKNSLNLQNIKLFITSLSWMALGGVSLGFYHLFLNWIVLGDPFAFISSVAKINPSSGPWDFDPDKILLSRLFYPFVVTFKNNPQSLGNISPLFIAFIPTLAIKKIRDGLIFSSTLRNLTYAALATISFWVFSFFTIGEVRYIFFLWIIIYLSVAKIMDRLLDNENKLTKNIVSTLIIATQCFVAARSLNTSFGAYSNFDSTGTPQCSNTPFCEYLKPINKQAKQGDRILTLGAYRYYLRSDLFECSTSHFEYIKLQELSSKDMGTFWREVYRLGFKFIAFEKDYTIRHLQFSQTPDPENTPAWMTLIPLYTTSSNEFAAYQIQVENPPIDMEVFCGKGSGDVWTIFE